ncbi:MAG: cupin [Hyphomicrobiales bacterium]|nr:MAG: cupin [Hyphomicrobiales bacterium]
MIKADDIIAKLGLEPHPEGGHFSETFRDDPINENANGRALSTAILYLLKAGEVSHWHRVDATEIWHWYGGAPLELSQAIEGNPIEKNILGNDIINGEAPQIIVPVNVWQSAKSLGDWTLLGCTVSPGFEFAGFEMAPAGWTP